MNNISSHFFTTNDGVKLHYLEAGQGETLLMLPGGGFSANVFQQQIQAFRHDYHVISLDKRGHGKSEKVHHGYRVSRFAEDLYDLLTHLKMHNVHVLGHSQGAAVVYNYFDLFGSQYIKTFIAVDQPAALLINPIWSKQERLQYGAVYEAATLHKLINEFLAKDNDTFKQNVVETMTSKTVTKEDKAFILRCLDIPGYAATPLYFNTICQDFRDVLPKIDIPTLFIGGKASPLPWQAYEWMHKKVPHSKLEIFSSTEGGSHFMFVENAKKFNQVVLSFLS